MYTILLLKDENNGSCALSFLLEQEGFFVIPTHDSATAFEMIQAISPHVLLIDLPIENLDGTELLHRIQDSGSRIPTIVLSENGDELERILFLEKGADDLMEKPVRVRELIARIRAILRRMAQRTSMHARFGDVLIDRERRVVQYKGDEVKITPCEYNLLLYFLENADRALTRNAILSSVWGYENYPNTRTVDAHVCKLRNKFESDPAAPRHFLTVHGVGYRFLTSPAGVN